jgi:hypothetical protein
MKFVVGVMLTAFGMFWGAEGAGDGLAGIGSGIARPHSRSVSTP